MDLPDPPADSPALLIQDRAYQRAAAKLYEGRYVNAAAAFNAIAADAQSPWQPWGRYLALRARLRHIEVTPPLLGSAYCGSPECAADRQKQAGWISSESAGLRSDIAFAMAEVHQRGQAGEHTDELTRLGELLSLVTARFAPELRLQELASEFANPDLAEDRLRLVLADYLYLHRQHPAAEPMGEWLRLNPATFRSTGPGCTDAPPADDNGRIDAEKSSCTRQQFSEKALARYQTDPQQRAWLFTAVSFADRHDSHRTALIQALDAVPDEHPGAATFALHRLRLADPGEADPLAQALLQRAELQADYSARNRVHEYAMRNSQSLPEFWKHALRTVGTPYDPNVDGPMQAEQALTTELAAAFDADGQWVIDHELPTEMLLATARDAPWPNARKRQVAELVWARAVLLENVVRARQAVELAISYGPEEPTRLQPLQAIDDDDRFLLESRLLLGSVRPMIGNWCTFNRPLANHLEAWRSDAWDWPGVYQRDAASRLLNADQRQTWRDERERLEAIPFSTNVRMQAALQLAAQHPADPRAPSVLRTAVYAPRFNYCGDESTSQLSRKAFALLKAKYPDSAAAKQTKYWYKPGR